MRVKIKLVEIEKYCWAGFAFHPDTDDVIGPVNPNVEVVDGEIVDIAFRCKAGENCNYPFCGSVCPGNEKDFYILGRESRY